MNTPELSFTTPAELLAALPHLLGFVPTEDMVVLLLGSAGSHTQIAMRAAIRCPLTIDDQVAEQFPQTCRIDAEQFPGAILVAVCDTDREEHAYSVLRTVRAAMHRHGIVVHRILCTHSVTDPGHWVDPDTGESGTTIVYTDSPATALGVVQGRLIAPSRDEMQREFATTEPVPPMDAEAQDIAALTEATTADLHYAMTQNLEPTTDLAMRAALVVTAHVGLRDALLRLAVGHELAAGAVWTQIAAAHRGRTRAELLTMAATAYYCGEDTVRAGIALTHAAAATRDDNSTLPRLGLMLSTALQEGMPPSKIRAIIPAQDSTRTPRANL
jgi:Domain of unknown function (DUF4192)